MNIYKDENNISQDDQIQKYQALDLQMPTELQKNAQDQNKKANIAQYLNIMLSKYNEWIMYKTTMSLTNDYTMNINIQSLIKTYKDDHTKEYGLNKDIKGIKQDYNRMVHELQTGGNKRMFNDNNDIYHTPLGVEYRLFENPLESTILMYLIENNFMIDLFEQDLHNDSLEHYDDVQLHLLGHQYETQDTNYFMAHLKNTTQKA